MKPLLVSVKQTAELLGLNVTEVYDLARKERLGPRRFVGKGTRNFRLEYAAVEAYANALPTEPVEDKEAS